MADAYIYIGDGRRGYFAYVDTDTSEMLIAEPGGTYQMRAVNPNLPVPPEDGRWVGAASETATATDAPVVAPKASSKTAVDDVTTTGDDQ